MSGISKVVKFFVFLLLEGLACSAFADAAPSITLSQMKGPPTTKILVSGTGWGQNTTVDIYFDKLREAFAVTDGSGIFSNVPIYAPGEAQPGKHLITAVETKNGERTQQTFLVQTDWRQAHFSPDHRGLNPYENLVDGSNVANLKLKWKFRTGNFVVSSPAVADGIVFFGSDDTHVYALDANTGKQLWTFATNGYVDASPAEDNGQVYIGSEDHNLYALDTKSGSLTYEFSGTAGFSDVTVGSEIYATSNFVLAFLPNLQWDWHSLSSAYGSPSTGYNLICVGGGGNDNDATISARGLNGQILWQFNGNGPPSSTTVLADSMVFFALGQDLYALDASDGALKWTYHTENFVGTPASAHGVVYVGAGAVLYALDARSGNLLWQNTDPSGYVIQKLSIANGLVYYGTDGNGNLSGTVSAVDARTGTLRWSYPADGAVFGAPVVVNGSIYFGTHGGSVYALGF